MKNYFNCGVAAFFVACSLWGSVSANAEAYQSEDGLKYELNSSDFTATFTGISADVEKNMPQLVIPDEVMYGGTAYKITLLGESCCASNYTVTSVSVGINVKTIAKNAFYNCRMLQTVTLPEGMESIDMNAFYSCTSLHTIDLPSTLKTIGDYSFYGDNGLVSVTIPASVTAIGLNPYGSCLSLSEFILEDGNESFCEIDGVLFNADASLLISYPVGNGLEEYTVPASVKKIGDNSMRNNYTLTSIVLQEGLEEIGAGAFNVCMFSTIDIPASVKFIGSRAFASCSRLSAYNVAEGNQNYKSINGFLLTKDGRKLLYGVMGMADVIIPEGVEEIDAYAFYKFNTVRTLKLSSTVKTIGQSAFYQCVGLWSVDLGPALESIGDMAFQYCNSIKDLVFPSTLRTLGNQTFAMCTAIREVTLPEGLVSVGTSTFFNCTGIVSAYIPGTIKQAGTGMFYNCTNLATVEMGEGLEFVGHGWFNYCYGLTSVVFSSTVKLIDEYAFSDTGLTSIDLPESLTTIGNMAFQLTPIENVVLPDAVESVGEMAFNWNDALKSFQSGKKLREIGAFAFGSAESLSSVTLNEGLKSIGESAFAYCSSIESIEIPASVENIGALVFRGMTGLKSITNHASVPQTLTEELFSDDFDGYSTVALKVPSESVNQYKEAAIWKKFDNIDGGVTSSIDDINVNEADIIEIYDINGYSVATPRKGLNICRMSDGSVRKIFY